MSSIQALAAGVRDQVRRSGGGIFVRFVVIAAMLASCGRFPLVRAAEDAAHSAGDFPHLAGCLDDLDRFQTALLSYLKSSSIAKPPDWDRVTPAVYRLLYDHRHTVQRLDVPQQQELFERVYDLIRAKRREKGEIALIEAGRPVIVFLHPDFSEEAKRIEYLATQFGAQAEVYPGAPAAANPAGDFCQRVGTLARQGKPATVWIWSHATKDSLATSKATALTSREFVDCLVTAPAGQARGIKTDFSKLYWIVDTCYATDFMLNASREMERYPRSHDVEIIPPALMVTSSTRDRVAWHKSFPDAIARQYLRFKNDPRQRWKQLKLSHFLEEVDFYLFCQGRKAVFDAHFQIRRYDVVHPERLQDLVVLIRLEDAEIAPLRRWLQLPDGSDVGPLFQIGRNPGKGVRNLFPPKSSGLAYALAEKGS